MNTVKNIVKSAHKSWEAWNNLESTTRANLLSNWANEIAQHATFGLMPSKMVKYQIKQGLDHIKETRLMPGPTGETNELYTAGRGIFIIASSKEASSSAIVGMVTTALLAGNCAILALDENHHALGKKLSETIISSGVLQDVIQLAPIDSIETLIDDTSTSGVAYAGTSVQTKILNTQLAARDGLIAQLIAETDLTSLSTITDSNYILRFITEKARSINVTAIGGNAALLELGGGDH